MPQDSSATATGETLQPTTPPTTTVQHAISRESTRSASDTRPSVLSRDLEVNGVGSEATPKPASVTTASAHLENAPISVKTTAEAEPPKSTEGAAMAAPCTDSTALPTPRELLIFQSDTKGKRSEHGHGMASSSLSPTPLIGSQTSQAVTTSTSGATAEPNDNPVSVEGPYRRSRGRRPNCHSIASTLPEDRDRLDIRAESTRTLRPIRGILKLPPPPQPKFNFRRDLLSYVGDTIHQAVVGASPTSSNLPTFASTSTDGLSTLSTSTSAVSILNTTSIESTPLPDNSPPSVSGQANATRTSGTLWKRLGGAVSAVTAAAVQASVPASQAAARTVNHFVDRHSNPRASDMDSLHRSGTLSHDDLKQEKLDPASVGDLQNLPTFHSPVDSNARIPPVGGSYNALKSVRFTISDLTVTYPLATSQAPGIEANTRRRVNKEYNQRKRIRSKCGWTSQELLAVYESACKSREEYPLPIIRQLLSVSCTIGLSFGLAQGYTDSILVYIATRSADRYGFSSCDDGFDKSGSQQRSGRSAVRPLVHRFWTQEAHNDEL